MKHPIGMAMLVFTLLAGTALPAQAGILQLFDAGEEESAAPEAAQPDTVCWGSITSRCSSPIGRRWAASRATSGRAACAPEQATTW